jgi:tRNA wybutosine-synthesizing protein 3
MLLVMILLSLVAEQLAMHLEQSYVNLLPLVSLKDKLMPRERERISHVENTECLTQSPILNSEAEKHKFLRTGTTTTKKVCNIGERHTEEFWMVRSREDGLHV